MLAARAFTEIRYLAGDARRNSGDASVEEDLERIRFLADLCHNLPGIVRPRPWRPSRRGTSGSSRERAMAERPMGWTWHTTGPEGRAWMPSSPSVRVRPDRSKWVARSAWTADSAMVDRWHLTRCLWRCTGSCDPRRWYIVDHRA
jgi:hypothetical protein